MGFPDRDVEEFQYVVYKKDPARVCFGSTLSRDTCPIGKNLSGFQSLFVPEQNTKLSPCTYETEDYLCMAPSDIFREREFYYESGEPIKFVTGGRSERFKDTIIRTPSPTRYQEQVDWGEIPKSTFPFDTSTHHDRRTYRDSFTPGPGSYKIDPWKCRKILKQDNFGHPTIDDVIEMICVSRPNHECSKCKTLCKGDYWHRDYTIFLCLLCWWEEKRTAEIYRPKQLAKFKCIRNCSFMHNHEGTDAAISILPRLRYKKKIRIERYLNNFMKC